MSASTSPNVCPFCALPTSVPHETQAACIAALRAEIARMRELLSHVKGPPGPPPDEDSHSA